MGRTPLPVSLEEAHRRGWFEMDVVLVSGDAYVDHPSFAMAMVGRALEAAGFRVGIIAQPDWRKADSFRQLGRPRLCFAVGGGNVDSMLAHYTARRRRRRDDPYSPGGQTGRRPDRATTVYAQRCREAFPGVPIIIGGIEASLRRLAHWDHWSQTVRPSILLSSRADLLVYGMGEGIMVELARRLQAEGPGALRYPWPSTCLFPGRQSDLVPGEAQELPSYEQCRAEPALLAQVSALLARQGMLPGDPPLIQRHGDRWVLHRAPAPPPTTADLDRWYDLPFTRREHPSLAAPVPALETVRWSVVSHRGCFGGCSFCALAEHQGKWLVSRSCDSIVRELEELARSPKFPGEISDLGGPSANMYGLHCRAAKGPTQCRRRSCLWPKPCKNLCTDPGPWLNLLGAARQVKGIRRVRVASGVRMDLLLRHRQALSELVEHHVGGQLKIAPEHHQPLPLTAMRKYHPGILREFKRTFDETCTRTGKKLYLVPYLLAGHPGTTAQDMVELARELKDLGLRPRQVQDFTPTPMTLSTAQHLAGRDPLTNQALHTVRGDKARGDQRALLQWFLPAYRKRAKRLLQSLKATDLTRAPSTRPRRGTDRRRRPSR